jgi:hypothetical protein
MDGCRELTIISDMKKIILKNINRNKPERNYYIVDTFAIENSTGFAPLHIPRFLIIEICLMPSNA